jgi:hypothetical protein
MRAIVSVVGITLVLGLALLVPSTAVAVDDTTHPSSSTSTFRPQ